MDVKFRNVVGYQEKQPNPIDFDSSPNKVYIRKGIKEGTDTEGNKCWIYEEALLDFSEYTKYRSEESANNESTIMEALADSYIEQQAQRDNQNTLMEAVADSYIEQQGQKDNQIIIMEALADIFTLLASLDTKISEKGEQV